MQPHRRALGLILSCIVLTATAVSAAQAAQQNGYKHVTKTGHFEDVFQDLKDAIINRGLVIDYVGHVGKMLERTSVAAGSVTESGSKSPYIHAKYLQFCSAKLTHESVSASPYNLAICPYVVFIFEAKSKPGEIVVGYRRPVPGPSKRTREAFAKIESLLKSILKEASTE